MKRYLSHYSAAKFWNIPHLEVILGFEIAKTRPIDMTVTNRKFRSERKGVNLHLCETYLPLNSVVLKNGTVVASPELVFLQLAPELKIHRLILLGLQLCSHPPGKPTLAITTKRKIVDFLAKTSGHYGRRKAQRAVKYINDGSASIMESITYMLLSLPHTLGGYGLDGAVFNYKIKLVNKWAQTLGQNHCFVDLYYNSAKLAVEYDSFTYHNSPTEQGRDMIRSTILERRGITVMHLGTIQVYNRNTLRDFAHNLAGRLGKRIQIRTKKFDPMQDRLHALLPRYSPPSQLPQ